MRPQFTGPIPGDQGPPALRGHGARRAVLATVTAAVLGFVPAIVLASPAHAAPGDVTKTSNLEVAEGDLLTFDLIREGGGASLTLNYAVTGTATSGADFEPFSGTTTFAASASPITKRFTVRGIADAIDEADETVIVTFTDASGGATVATFNHLLVDDEPTPTYTLSTTNPIAESAGNAVVTATLSAPSGLNITIPVTTANGTATAGQDYTAITNGVITIPAGDPSGTINVPVSDDTLDESDTQTFTVAQGTNPVANVQNSGSSLSVNIADNDAPPVISVTNPANAVEGSPLTFVATLSAASERTVTVVAYTVDGTAIAGTDYTAVANQTVTFVPGDVSEAIVVATTADVRNEAATETLDVVLSSPTLATLSPSQGMATGGIDDDDAAPTIALTPSTAAEGDSGVSNRTFTVTLSAASGRTVTVGYSTSSDTAMAGEDFANVTPGTLTFLPGETVKTFDVPVYGDVKHEGNEAFNIVLSNPGNTLGASASLGTTSITLIDDDAMPTLTTFPDITRAEGTGPAVFVLSLSNPSDETITLNVAAVDGTALVDGSGLGSNDYDAPDTTVTFLPGETGKNISVNVNADSIYEGNETATINVTIPGGETDVTGAAVDAILTLTNDDAAPAVTLSTESGVEGSTLAVKATVVGVAQDAIPVSISLAGQSSGPGGNAADLADFVNGGPFTVNIPAGDNTAAPFTVHTFLAASDVIDETTETVLVTLTDPNAIVATTSAMQSILDDAADLPPTISVSDGTVAESAGTVDVPVALTFDAATNNATSTEVPVVVNYTTVDDGATAGSDYTAAANGASITVAPSLSGGVITVPIIEDTAYELDEKFKVNITSVSPAAAVVTDASATVTISENDLGARPGFSVTPTVSKVEGAAGPASFTVTLTSPAPQDVTFTVAASNGTAVDGGTSAGSNDYDAPSTTVTIPQGSTMAAINVPVNNDAVFEATETMTLGVSLAIGENDAVGGPTTSTLTITDTDAAPTVTVNQEAGSEGTNIAVVATVDGATQDAIPLQVTLVGASRTGSDAAEVSDFVNAGPVTVTIPAGVHDNELLPIREFRANNDTVDENVETVVATVTDPAEHVITASNVLKINDDLNDTAPSVAIGDASVAEDAGPVTVDVALTFQGDTTGTERTVVVNYSTANGTAVAGSDYSATTGHVDFAQGIVAGEIVIPVTADTVDEPNQTFTVQVTSVSPTDVTVTDDSGTVTINDDDADVPPPTFAVQNVTRAEDDGPAVFTVALSHASSQDITFATTTEDGTAVDVGSGLGSNDYNAPPATLTIAAGQTTGSITVPVNDDQVFEGAETAVLYVGLAEGETDAVGESRAATLSITDDEAVPSISLNSTSNAEGEDLAVTATVTGRAQDDMVFDLTLSGNDDGSNNAAEGGDYEDNGLQATIPAGTASGSTIILRSIHLNDDTIDEPQEAINVVVEDVDGDVVTKSSVYKINDDVNDLAPSVSISDESIDEGQESVDLTVSLAFNGGTTETERDMRVDYYTVNGNATSPQDYTAEDGSITIPAGQTSGTVNVLIQDDNRDESDQNFFVKIDGINPNDGGIDDDSGEVVIVDNDETVAPTLVAPTGRVGAGPVTVTGVAREGTQVQLWTAPYANGDDFDVVAYTTAGTDGSYSFTRHLPTGYRLYTRANGLNSPIKVLRVKHDPVFTGGSTARGTVALRVVGDPKLAGLTVQIQRQNANNSWTTIATGKTGSTGQYDKTFTGLRSGTAVTYRAVIVGDPNEGLLTGVSSVKRVGIR